MITDALNYNRSRIYHNEFKFINKYREIELFHMNNTNDQLLDIVLEGSLFDFDM